MPEHQLTQCLLQGNNVCFHVSVVTNEFACLTHWGRDKMSADFPDDQFKCILLNVFAWISIEIALKFPINNSTALVQMMAWHQLGDKLVSEPMIAQVTDAYMHLWASVSQDDRHNITRHFKS